MASEELKQEAKELGIKFNPNIGDDKLQDKIDAHYESQETSKNEIQEAVEAKEAQEEAIEEVAKTEVGATPKKAEKSVVNNGPKTKGQLAREIFEKAKKTRVVTIIDNDQRVNNQTTTCKANWSNAYHDLGTRIFPLNVPVEVPQGFIQVLKEVQIPHHVKDNKTGLHYTTMRSRYSISDENVDTEN